jgi:hypothetical protein
VEYPRVVLPLIGVLVGVGGVGIGFWFEWALFLTWAACAAVSVAEGKWRLVACDLVLWLFSYFAAFRLAKPWSWWARKRYDEATMHRAHLRYGEQPPRTLFARS